MNKDRCGTEGAMTDHDGYPLVATKTCLTDRHCRREAYGALHRLTALLNGLGGCRPIFARTEMNVGPSVPRSLASIPHLFRLVSIRQGAPKQVGKSRGGSLTEG
jgi:hypothetical protein